MSAYRVLSANRAPVNRVDMSIPSQLPQLLMALDAERVVVTRAQMVERYGEKAYQHGLLDGIIVKVLPGLYAHRSRAEKLSTRLTACSRWLADDEAISGLAACRVHGLEPRSVPHITILLSSARRPRTPSWLRTHTFSRLPPVLNVSGYRVVAIEHALIHALSEHGVEFVKGLIIDAIRDDKCDVAVLLAALESTPRVSQRRKIVRFLSTLKRGIESYLEELADTTIFNVSELQGLERQVVFVVDGKKYRVDAYDRQSKTAIELDSRKHHGSEEARRRDIERDAALASIGIQTLRFTYEQVDKRPLWCRKMILATIAARRIATLTG